MEFEQTFDIRIPDDDAERLQTFDQAVKYIQEKVKKWPASQVINPAGCPVQ